VLPLDPDKEEDGIDLLKKIPVAGQKCLTFGYEQPGQSWKN